ncbi:hypothetical protein [Euhalothece natronophila]|nr:hypothetical protein [Euhalothece natronophila]
MVIRKLRQRCGQNFLCIGTSATMSTEEHAKIAKKPLLKWLASYLG